MFILNSIKTNKCVQENLKKIYKEFSGYSFKLSNRDPGRRKNPPLGSLGVKECPDHVDIAIIGGGPMGSSVAYWLKENPRYNDLSVVVIERDLTYGKCSAVLSNGGMRQQFSLPENILLSLFSAKFIANIQNILGEGADVNFRPHGYLYLTSESQAEQLIQNSKLQNELGAKNRILPKSKLKEQFPYMNFQDVELGCLGEQFEGWFDPWLYLQVMKKASESKAVQYVQGEVVGFEFDPDQKPTIVVVKLSNNEIKNISFTRCVIAAGCESGKIGKLSNIGTGKGVLSVPIPVERRKRFVFGFNCMKNAPPVKSPFVIDTDGTFHRREGLGTNFIGGYSPKQGEPEPTTDNLEVDFDLFNDVVWPNLAHRVPAFEAIKPTNAWGGYYDFNYFDENGIIGKHPYYKNVYLATGFSGHGIMQACAVGKAVSELLTDGRYKTIDLTRLGFERFIENTPMMESLII